MGLNFPTSALVTSRSFIKRNENTVENFCGPLSKGIHYAKTHREFSVRGFEKLFEERRPPATEVICTTCMS